MFQSPRIAPLRGYLGRLRLMAICFALLGALFVGRLYYLQIMNNDRYTALADRQFVEPQNSLFSRGVIYFTGKDGSEVAAAMTRSGVSLAVEPPRVENPESLFASLSSVLPLDREEFLKKLGRPGARYVVLENRLSTTTGAALSALKLPGVVLATDRWRYYPGGPLAAQSIGFVAYKGDALEGRYGLEHFYETTLKRSESSLYTNFFVELFSGAKKVLAGSDEGDLVTTIEPSVQAELERELALYMEKWQPRFAGGIIMDPKTGAIYAMAQMPNFNLNEFGSQEDIGVYRNRMVEDSYEMGSIIKPLTVAAGLDAGVITASSTYKDTGCINVDEAKICNWDGKARGTIAIQQILSQSLNVGASHVATLLGPERMRWYFKEQYGFGKKTGIDLPGEVSGQVGNFGSPRALEYDTASFGQGFAATPIQTVRALGVLANGGALATPHLVRAVRTGTGEEELSWPSTQILSPQAVEEVERMLTEVVDTALENGDVKLNRWSVAAKTGTAQIANPAGGGYYDDRYLHSFFGFFPSYDARFIIFLFSLEPQGAEYSSQTWTRVFSSLTRFLIHYYSIPPDR